MKRAKSKAAGKHHHPEHHARQIILVGAAFIVVMLIAIGFRQSNDRYAAVYTPRQPVIDSSAPSDDMHAGACCAEGECLDLTRDECKGSGYVYWPDADLCLTACQVVK